MAGIVKLGKFAATKIANKSSLGVVIRTASHWNKDWKPGPYPETQAEREAAAKKYGIPIEDYKPYENDGTGHGDYPKLPEFSVERRDPYYPYDFPESKRNFGDAYHVDSDLYSEDRYNNGEIEKKLIAPRRITK
jgi:NADH dehydrogenase (ubiquinone) 1 beta subcomplex subunit 8